MKKTSEVVSPELEALEQMVEDEAQTEATPTNTTSPVPDEAPLTEDYVTLADIQANIDDVYAQTEDIKMRIVESQRMFTTLVNVISATGGGIGKNAVSNVEYQDMQTVITFQRKIIRVLLQLPELSEEARQAIATRLMAMTEWVEMEAASERLRNVANSRRELNKVVTEPVEEDVNE